MRNVYSIFARGVRVVCATVIVAGSSAAQSPARDVVFVHGLTQNGTSWNAMKPALDAQLHISSSAPSLSWQASYTVQADQLASHLGNKTNVVSVSHSNGGVVTRRHLTTGTTPRVGGHISLGSPHHGAQLAASAHSGAIDAWLAMLLNSVAQPIFFYGQNDPAFAGHGAFVSEWGYVFQLLVNAMAISLSSGGFLASAAQGTPVIPEMFPGSAFHQSNNSSASLVTEASRSPIRIGISTNLPPDDQPFSLLVSNPSAAKTTLLMLQFAAYEMYDYYSFHPNPLFRAYAYLWSNLAYQVNINVFQLNWFYLQGSLTQTPSGQLAVKTNDGVVTWESSTYPGGTSLYLPASVFGSVAHSEQQLNPALRERVRSILRADFGVQNKPPTSPPPPNPVIINGADQVPFGASCLYVAGANQGTSPYTFEWYLDGTFVGTGESMMLSFGSSPAFISVTAYDVNGLVGSGGLQITPSTEAFSCEPE